MPRNYYDDFTPKDYARYNMPKRKKKDENFFHNVKKAIIIGCACILAGVVSLELYLASLPPIQNLDKFKPNIVTKFYANDENNVIKTFTAYTYQKVDFNEVPDNMKKALIATEDKNFYHHHGYDPAGLARSTIENVMAGHVVQGASTITQQLARILFLSNERTFDRKIKELFIAARIEKTIPKDKILEMYMNNVYLGSGAYGVEGAAQIYFDKHLKDCDLAELALLAGLPQAPSVYSPFNSMDLAVKRRNQVLLRMYKMKYITKDEMDQAKKEKIHLAAVPQFYTTNKAPYFCDYVLKELEKLGYDETEISQGGYKIVTTLDYDAQIAANEAILKNMRRYGLTSKENQAAVFSFNPIDGKILVYAGGKNYVETQYDRVTQAVRPPGSAFKPFVYAAALEKGVRPTDMISDSPITIGKWSPRNYNGRYRGKIPVYKALMVSSNVCAARLIQEVGVRAVQEMTQVLGITTPLENDATIALGSNGIKLFEITRAYGAFANGGYVVQPYAIERIETSRGKVVYQAPKTKVSHELSMNTASEMTAMLKTVILHGTGRAANIGKPAAGKTGTTDDYRDASFIGYTPNIVTGVWVGRDDNKQMRGVQGGTVPALIWHDVMMVATKKYGDIDFDYPEIPLGNDNKMPVKVQVVGGTDETDSNEGSSEDEYVDESMGTPAQKSVTTRSSRSSESASPSQKADFTPKSESQPVHAPIPMANPDGLRN
ncbi:MAG: PBP1A family penicillin-binding protein [Clostridiaceae bacterium]|jgi:penicillin-binding protein 1A|nr:PBP1A family penicillin-binding protein [Clostridiaceae bacterium]